MTNEEAWRRARALVRIAPGPVLLHGRPGTGKTRLACSNAGERTVANVTLTEDLPAAELRGFWCPRDGWAWMDGVALMAVRAGGRLVLNEIQRASADTLGFLLAVLDLAQPDDGIATLTLPSGETVRAGTGLQVIGTMNGDPEMLDPALLSRFPFRVPIAGPDPSAYDALPHDMREWARKQETAGERALDLRAMFAFARLRAEIDETDAAAVTFGQHADAALTALRMARA